MRSSSGRAFIGLAVCLGVLLSAGASAQGVVKKTVRNTLTFNHLTLTAEASSPYVLAVGHGEYFQVVFDKTDPRFFDYSISAISGDSPTDSKLEGPNTPVDADASSTVAVTMRHDRHIQKYTVAVTLKSAGSSVPVGETSATETTRALRENGKLPDKLYPISFDLWVRTSEWTVGFNGGFAFSNIVSDKYYLHTDTKGTATADDDVKTVKVDTSARDQYRPDIIALANVSHTDRFYGLGLAFGVGIGENSEARYFFGPSWTFGKNFIFTGGLTGGKVNWLPAGQELDKPPIAGDNTLNTLGSKFKKGWFVGIGFTFADKKDDFLGALGATTKSKANADAAAKPEAGDEAAPTPAEDETSPTALVGTYQSDSKRTFVVALKKAGEKDLTIAIDGKPAVDLVWQNKGLLFKAGEATVRFKATEKDKPTGLTYRDSAGAVDAPKTK